MESKSFPEQLGAWTRQQKPGSRKASLAAFLTVHDDVRAALDAGYRAKTIWAYLLESRRIHCSYSCFLFHANGLRRQHAALAQPASAPSAMARPATMPVKAGAAPPANVNRNTGDSVTSAHASTSGIPGFKYNPTSNIEDLFGTPESS